MIEPNADGPKWKNKYRVNYYADGNWIVKHYDTLDEAVSKIKKLENDNLIWSLVPVKI